MLEADALTVHGRAVDADGTLVGFHAADCSRPASRPRQTLALCFR